MAATTPDADIPSREFEVRLLHAMEDWNRWNALARVHHYLPRHHLFGKALHHVAIHDHSWLARISWQAGAFRAASATAGSAGCQCRVNTPQKCRSKSPQFPG